MFPESGRGLGHVTPTIFGIRSNISPKLLELEISNLVRGWLCMGNDELKVSVALTCVWRAFPVISQACSQNIRCYYLIFELSNLRTVDT